MHFRKHPLRTFIEMFQSIAHELKFAPNPTNPQIVNVIIICYSILHITAVNYSPYSWTTFISTYKPSLTSNCTFNSCPLFDHIDNIYKQLRISFLQPSLFYLNIINIKICNCSFLPHHWKPLLILTHTNQTKSKIPWKIKEFDTTL